MERAITREMIEGFFADTRRSRDAGRMKWNVDDVCRWSFFLIGEEGRLCSVADQLEGLGYEIVGFLEKSGDADEPFILRVDRVERHSEETLLLRNEELYELADQFDLQYDGMDVGATDGP